MVGPSGASGRTAAPGVTSDGPRSRRGGIKLELCPRCEWGKMGTILARFTCGQTYSTVPPFAPACHFVLAARAVSGK
jgi:hypothetical protein